MNNSSTRLCVWVLVSALVGVASCTSSTAHTAVVSSPAPGSATPAPTSLPATVPQSGTVPRSDAQPATATGPDTGTQPATATGPATTVASPRAPFGVADFAAVGVGVYADAGQQEPLLAVSTSWPATPIRLLQTQLTAGLLEVADGQGVLGSILDGVIPTDPGLAPPSFLIAGWVSGSGSPGALLAHRMMGDHDWTQAPSLLFPGLVLALYSADAARFADALAGPGAALPTDASGSATPDQPASRMRAPGLAGVTGSAGLSRPLTVGVCAQVKGFVDNVVTSMFDALGHLQSPQVPSAGNVVLDFFGAGIQTGLNLAVGVVNGLIDAGRFLVVNGIKLAVQPILDQVAKVASALGVVALVTNFLRPWTIRMVTEPASTRKAVGSEPGLAGTVGATVDLGGFDEWPAEIIGCAQTAGVTLPSLKPVGAPITWKFDQSPGDLAVEDPGKATVLDANAHAELAYTTTQEDEETAKGDVRTGTMSFHVSIRRKEIADFQQTIGNLLFAQIPSLIAPILSGLLRPTLDSVLATLPSFLDSTAQVPVPVVYHDSTTTTTTTPPTDCTDNGNTIPAGTFTGDMAGAFQITEPPIPGQNDETFTGHIVLISTGTTVSGTMSMHWSGGGQINNAQLSEDSTLQNANLSGSSADPIVNGTIVGQIVIDGVANTGSYPVHFHLHILQANCQSVTADPIAMLRENLPGSTSLINGNSTWTASR